MKSTLQPGVSASHVFEVTDAQTVPNLPIGNGLFTDIPHVLATANMIAMMEGPDVESVPRQRPVPVARGEKDHPRPVDVGLGSDVGAGTSFSALATLNEAYKVARLCGDTLTALGGFFLATLGGARAMGLAHRSGRSPPGARLISSRSIPVARPLLALRTGAAQSIEDVLFALMTLGDDRAVQATYVAGSLAHRRE